jgi:hypothetical protein
MYISLVSPNTHKILQRSEYKSEQNYTFIDTTLSSLSKEYPSTYKLKKLLSNQQAKRKMPSSKRCTP